MTHTPNVLDSTTSPPLRHVRSKSGLQLSCPRAWGACQPRFGQHKLPSPQQLEVRGRVCACHVLCKQSVVGYLTPALGCCCTHRACHAVFSIWIFCSHKVSRKNSSPLSAPHSTLGNATLSGQCHCLTCLARSGSWAIQNTPGLLLSCEAATSYMPPPPLPLGRQQPTRPQTCRCPRSQQ